MVAVQLENLVRIGQLRREAPVADELAGLKRSAESRLADATRPDLSFASRFDLAYNAAHALALCLQRAGHRSTNQAHGVSGAGPQSRLEPAKWRVLVTAGDPESTAQDRQVRWQHIV